MQSFKIFQPFGVVLGIHISILHILFCLTCILPRFCLGNPGAITRTSGVASRARLDNGVVRLASKLLDLVKMTHVYFLCTFEDIIIFDYYAHSLDCTVNNELFLINYVIITQHYACIFYFGLLCVHLKFYNYVNFWEIVHPVFPLKLRHIFQNAAKE